jgi:hypothetical protein
MRKKKKKKSPQDIFGKYQLVALFFPYCVHYYVGKRTYLNYRRWYFSCKLQSKCFHRYTLDNIEDDYHPLHFPLSIRKTTLYRCIPISFVIETLIVFFFLTL